MFLERAQEQSRGNAASLFTQPARRLKKRFQFHRDFAPRSSLPLRGLQTDYQANAAGHLTWNVALYDDASLWVVPGSNRRATSDAEQEVLNRPAMLSDEPVPGAVPCELAAGDAAAFDATMIHSGSNNTDTFRRTFNVSYRAFGGPVFPHNRGTSWKPDILERLTPQSARAFSRFELLLGEERDTIAVTFHAMVNCDEPAFHRHLAQLHPGEQGRMACVVLLDKIAYSLWTLSRRDSGSISNDEYGELSIDHPHNSWRTAWGVLR